MTRPSRYRIVIALDDSEYAELVLEHGLDQAARHDAPELHVVRVVDSEDETDAAKRWLATTVLEGLESFRAGRPDWYTRLHVRLGKAAEEIATLAGEADADLLVIGRYWAHHTRHSLAEQLVRVAPCPTLVVGLSGHEVDAERQCLVCVALRAESNGERWFCTDHSAPDRLSTRVPWSGPQVQGGLLW